MKVLLDENLPHELRHRLPGHEVFTVTYLGWNGIVNGALIARAAEHGFDALITKDVGIQHEQNTGQLPLSVVCLRARSNKLSDFEHLLPSLVAILNNLKPRAFVLIPSE